MKRNLSSLFHRVVYFTVKSPDAAKRLADKLVTSPNDSIILPFIDHPGPISTELLARNTGSLTFCERDDKTRHLFQEHVLQNYPQKRVKIFPEDLFDLSFKDHNDVAQRKCSDIVNQSLNHDEHSTSQEDNNENKDCDKQVKFLVPLLRSRYEAGFLRNIYYQMALRLGLCSTTLVHYYFLMSDRQYNYLNAKPSGSFARYRSATILYNTIFNVHKLDSLDLNTCFGISLRKIQKTSQNNKSAYRQVHLIWLEPKLEVVTNMNAKALLEYRFFVNQIMTRRTGLVLPFIDRWFGDCSEDIAELGITKTSRSGDLTQDQYYKLFIYLRNKPEYAHSTFLQAAERSEDNFLSSS